MRAIFANHRLHLLVAGNAEGTGLLLSLVINLLANELLLGEVVLAEEAHKVTLQSKRNNSKGYHVVHLSQSLNELVVRDILVALRTDSLKRLTVAADAEETLLIP